MTVLGRIYLVWSHEHNMWWGPNWRGYTSHLDRAGRYHESEAEKICGTRGWQSPVQPPEVYVLGPEADPPPAGSNINQVMEDRVTAATGQILATQAHETAAAFLRLQRAYNSLKFEIQDVYNQCGSRADGDDRPEDDRPKTPADTYQEIFDDLQAALAAHQKEYGDRGF